MGQPCLQAPTRRSLRLVIAVLLCGYPEILLPTPGVFWKVPPGCNCSKDPSEPFNYLVKTGGFRFSIQVQQQRPGRQRKNVSPSRLKGLEICWGSTYNEEPLKMDWEEKLEDSELEFLFRFVLLFLLSAYCHHGMSYLKLQKFQIKHKVPMLSLHKPALPVISLSPVTSFTLQRPKLTA